MADNGFLLIPDISGFTRFVNETEARHAGHIVSELLEAILESNEIGLEVSEIEGDAVLFFRMGEPPKLDDLLSQIEKTFVSFHQFLRVIERDRICQCGACSTASNLTLKFVAHAGAFTELPVGDFKKLFGSDVILAHRLLKTDIPSREHALFTDRYLAEQRGHSSTGVLGQLEPHVETVEEFGDIDLKLVDLGPLRETLAEPPARAWDDDPGTSVRVGSVHVRAPLGVVHEVVSDHWLKRDFVDGLQDVRFDGPINRAGGGHTCVFDDLEVHFVTIGQRVAADTTHFRERVAAGGLRFVSDFALQEVADGTQLILSYIRQPDSDAGWLARLKNAIAWFLVRRNSGRALKEIKAYAERRASSQASPRGEPASSEPVADVAA